MWKSLCDSRERTIGPKAEPFAARVVARLLAPKPFRARTALGIAAVLVVGVIATGGGFVMLDLVDAAAGRYG